MSVECDREVALTEELLIGHKKSLKIHNMKWLASVQDEQDPLLGRPMLEALGIDKKQLLEAMADKYRGTVDCDSLETEPGQIGGSVCSATHSDQP